jgi:hypothetical protein
VQVIALIGNPGRGGADTPTFWFIGINPILDAAGLNGVQTAHQRALRRVYAIAQTAQFRRETMVAPTDGLRKVGTLGGQPENPALLMERIPADQH